MLINLLSAGPVEVAQAVFDNPISEHGDPWYFGDVDFQVDPDRQVRALTDLLTDARTLLQPFSDPQVSTGLWCMMGAVHYEAFFGLIWNPTLPLAHRLPLVSAVYQLYDQVLAPYPYAAIDFRHPDDDERRFTTIDYMAPDLLLHHSASTDPSSADAAAVRGGFLELFSQLLGHPAPVAQYAGLHGLGHLEHEGRVGIIDTYLDRQTWLDPDHRRYAEDARRGHVL